MMNLDLLNHSTLTREKPTAGGEEKEKLTLSLPMQIAMNKIIEGGLLLDVNL